MLKLLQNGLMLKHVSLLLNSHKITLLNNQLDNQIIYVAELHHITAISAQTQQVRHKLYC